MIGLLVGAFSLLFRLMWITVMLMIRIFVWTVRLIIELIEMLAHATARRRH